MAHDPHPSDLIEARVRLRSCQYIPRALRALSRQSGGRSTDRGEYIRRAALRAEAAHRELVEALRGL